MNLNTFGDPLYEPLDALQDSIVRPRVCAALKLALVELGVEIDCTEELLSVLEGSSGHLADIEARLSAFVGSIIRAEDIESALHRRARAVAEQIAEHLLGSRIVDVGCGDGLISHYVNRRDAEFILVDVVDYFRRETGLEFRMYDEGGPLPISQGWSDTSLLLTVLHHAEEPLSLLQEVRRITRRRLIVIESVVGVTQQTDAWSLLRGLDYDQQSMYASFIDWWYNRILHCGVPVPFNFSSISNWQRIFSDHSLRLMKTIDLGMDHRLVPEHHVLFVLDCI
jgi:SAM-dependent methyltransferase